MIVCACCGAAIAFEPRRMLCDDCRGVCPYDSFSGWEHSDEARDARRERECEAFLREPHDRRLAFLGAIA